MVEILHIGLNITLGYGELGKEIHFDRKNYLLNGIQVELRHYSEDIYNIKYLCVINVTITYIT